MPSLPLRRLVAALGAALLAATASPALRPADEGVGAGHARMLALLERRRVESRGEHPFLGTAGVTRLEQRLARLPDDPRDPRGARLRFRLGSELLRVGRAGEAAGLLREALERARRIGAVLADDEAAEAWYLLAIACLREAEDRNCCLASNAESCILPIQGGGVHRDPTCAREAAQSLERALALATPGGALALKSRWLLNVACMTLGTYPDGVPERERIDPSTFASDEPFPRFVDVATEIGLERQELAGGLVVEDLDGDGALELMTSSWDTAGQLRLYGRDGSGGFVERTEQANLTGLYGGLNLVSGDWDDDGDVDVLVLRGAWLHDQGHVPNSLLSNDGRGAFRDVTFDVGLAEPAYPTQTAAFADCDNDGDLDLYVGNESEPDDHCPGQLFRNDGERFTDVAAAAGVTNDRYAKGVAWGDVDGDGFQDLFVSNMGSPNRLYRNAGDGTFQDVTERAGVGRPTSAFACWFFDYDSDGALDLWVTSYGGAGKPPDLAAVAASYLGLPEQAESMCLYRGDGRGGFRDVAAEQGLGLQTLPMGVSFGDLDGDGWLDVYLGTGYPHYEGLIPNVMLRNRAGQGFADVTTAGGFGCLQKGHGSAFADLDDDGDQDVLMKMGGAYPGDRYRPLVFENPGFASRWIEVRLVGRRSNRFGVGARLCVEIEEDGRPRTIRRTVGTGGSFGCGPLRQQIGLGRAERVLRLEVVWPASGERQELRDLPVDRSIEIVEGEPGWRTCDRRPLSVGDGTVERGARAE